VIESIALAVLSVTGLYFITFGFVSLMRPIQASQFLLGFASSPTKHYGELIARFIVGGSLVVVSSLLFYPLAFSLFGWVLLVTTAGLLIIPWKWHHRFTQRAVPRATRYISLIGVSSIGLGGLLLAAVALGVAT